MSDRLTKLFAELHSIQNKAAVQALASAPLARPLPSTKEHSMFARTSDLQATIAKIRAIEAANPTLAKYPATAFPSSPFCNKKDLEQAQRHLATISAKAPRKPIAPLARPTAAKASTSPAKAPAGRNAAELLALDPQAQNRLILAAMPLAAKPLRDELRAAFKSAPAALRTKFASTFRNALNAHERDQAPSISKVQFDQLNPQQKMDSAKAGIKIS